MELAYDAVVKPPSEYSKEYPTDEAEDDAPVVSGEAQLLGKPAWQPEWADSWRTANRYYKSALSHMQNKYRAIESVAQPGNFVNVAGNKNKSGSKCGLWPDKAATGSVWHLDRVSEKIAVYYFESQIAPGMYLSVGTHECEKHPSNCPLDIVLGFNLSYQG